MIFIFTQNFYNFLAVFSYFQSVSFDFLGLSLEYFIPYDVTEKEIVFLLSFLYTAKVALHQKQSFIYLRGKWVEEGSLHLMATFTRNLASAPIAGRRVGKTAILFFPAVKPSSQDRKRVCLWLHQTEIEFWLLFQNGAGVVPSWFKYH